LDFNLIRPEDGIKTDELFFCIDCGTTLIKTLLLDKTGYAYKKYTYEDFPYSKITRMADLNKCKIITTGAKSDALKLSCAEYEIANYSEIKCISKLPVCLGLERTVVACIGTGSPFVAFENGEGVHLGGTGVGGGAFIGLSERLLGVRDPVCVEEMAAGGDASGVNIMVGDIYKGNMIDELQIDYTASNFAKPAPSGTAIQSPQYRNDVALGIHSLIGEVVGSMAGQLAKYNGYDSVVFCGTVCENKIICGILSNCLSIYGMKPIFIKNPGFGTCFGAIMQYISEKPDHHKPEQNSIS